MPSRVFPLSSDALELIAARFKVLGEPTRLRILQELNERERSIGELTEILQLSQPNVSKHVRLLQDAGLVARRQEGNTVYCSIADPSVHELCAVVCGSLRERLSAQASQLKPGRRRS